MSCISESFPGERYFKVFLLFWSIADSVYNFGFIWNIFKFLFVENKPFRRILIIKSEKLLNNLSNCCDIMSHRNLWKINVLPAVKLILLSFNNKFSINTNKYNCRTWTWAVGPLPTLCNQKSKNSCHVTILKTRSRFPEIYDTRQGLNEILLIKS